MAKDRRDVRAASEDSNGLSLVSAKQFFAGRPPSSTQLLRRAAETDPEAANLLSGHPRNADGAILLVHLFGR
jgi:hypothetical protein